MEDFRKKTEAENAAIRALMDLIIASDAPEGMKLDMQILKADSVLCDMVHSLSVRAFSTNPVQTEAFLEVQKDVLEYLGLVATGIKQFTESLNFPEENN